MRLYKSGDRARSHAERTDIKRGPFEGKPNVKRIRKSSEFGVKVSLSVLCTQGAKRSSVLIPKCDRVARRPAAHSRQFAHPPARRGGRPYSFGSTMYQNSIYVAQASADSHADTLSSRLFPVFSFEESFSNRKRAMFSEEGLS